MNLRLKKIVTIAILICFIAITVFSAVMPFIANATPTQDDLNDIAEKKEEQQKKIDEAKEEQQDALTKKSSLEQQIVSTQSEIDNIQADIDDAQARIAQKEEEVKIAQQKADDQYETMKIRLRTMYETNSSSYISLLFSADSINDFLLFYELIQQLLDYDNSLYDNMLLTKQGIETAKKDIETEKEGYEQSQQDLIAKRDDLEQLESDLDSTISKLANDIDEYKKAYEEFEREEQMLKAQIAAALRNSSSGTANYSGGTLQWPTPGYATITSPYGYRVHPTLNVYKLHTGIDIAAPMYAKVVAAEDGVVVTSQYSSAYGNYIVINHGNGVSTLYAHHSANLVSAGDYVVRGQQIAQVGSTGFSTGPHSHFEVLLDGASTDPMAYLQ